MVQQGWFISIQCKSARLVPWAPGQLSRWHTPMGGKLVKAANWELRWGCGLRAPVTFQVSFTMTTWTPTQYGGRVPREQGGNAWRFYALALEVTEHRFHSTHRVHIKPVSRKKERDPITQWWKCQGHIVGSACGMGDL